MFDTQLLSGYRVRVSVDKAKPVERCQMIKHHPGNLFPATPVKHNIQEICVYVRFSSFYFHPISYTSQLLFHRQPIYNVSGGKAFIKPC